MTRLVASVRPCHKLIRSKYALTHRSLFNFMRKSPGTSEKDSVPTDGNLFYPFSKSPFPAIHARGEAVKGVALCPICTSPSGHVHTSTQAQIHLVKFECPDCGWPTHCTEEHWKEDEEHAKYCSRLKEVNEDEHDLRSGRQIHEFELPGPQAYEEAISFANWDIFWYTRGFPSMDTERSRRHASKLLTYPITIGSILHQNSSLTLGNQRVTPEGSRSLAVSRSLALRTMLHVPPGAPDTEEASASKPQMRIFILGARAESSLPPHVWEQMCMLFPSAHFHLYFIGPQVSLPKPPNDKPPPQTSSGDKQAMAGTNREPKPVYLPNIYEPPTPAPITRHKHTRSSVERYGVPSYTVPFTSQLTITGMQANYSEVHAQFEDSLDPYCDVFFLFSPGFGFPSASARTESDSQPLLQIASSTEWGPVVPMLLSTKCPVFVTGFSPVDIERDVRSLSIAPGVAGEFDWILTPGPNAFGSEKWEIADFDPRVMVKTNWGIWGIRGKSRDVKERGGYSFSL